MFCQLTTLEEQFFEGILDMAIFDSDASAVMALIGGEKGGFADQFADESCTDALRLVE